MSRQGRKGAFSRTHAPSASGKPTLDSPTPIEFRANVVSNRGHGAAELNSFDLGPLASIPLFVAHLTKIQRETLAGKTGTSLKNIERSLRSVVEYCDWYGRTVAAAPSHVGDVNLDFCHCIIPWLVAHEVSNAERSRRFRLFRKCMEAIGVSDTLIPSNPFPDEADAQDRSELSRDEAQLLLKQGKMEARVVLARRAEMIQLTGVGSDPRRGHGGRNGDWREAANRIWVMQNVFKLEIRKFDELRFERGLNTELKGLEGRPGAEIISTDGSIVRQVGWKGHLRWFYPWPDDLAPFLVMFLLRTGANLAASAALRTGAWEEPYPFTLGDASNETHVYIVTYKTRGRRRVGDSSTVVKFISSRRPWSHPYRVLQAVEDLTRDLRTEVDRQVSELRGKATRTSSEESDLKRLEAIRNDLFIYKNEQGITSLAWETRGKHDTPRWLAAFMLRARVDSNTRRLRDAAILFSYDMSGQNLFVAQLTAAHASQETTALYLRRSKNLNRIFDQAVNVFGLSLELIASDRFDTDELKRALAEQGFDEQEIERLESPDNVARWGNRCANPTRPPREFARGTPTGAVCVGQDCIDGCPYARWFRDSIGHVARNLVVAENVVAALGNESIEGSSHLSRIERCHLLLGNWPAAEVAAAVEEARRALRGSDDLFLGAAL